VEKNQSSDDSLQVEKPCLEFKTERRRSQFSSQNGGKLSLTKGENCILEVFTEEKRPFNASSEKGQRKLKKWRAGKLLSVSYMRGVASLLRKLVKHKGSACNGAQEKGVRGGGGTLTFGESKKDLA